MFQADLFRTATFRLTVAFVVVIILGMLLQFGSIYVQMNTYNTVRTNDFLQKEAALLVRESPRELEYKIREKTTSDLRIMLNGAALFDLRHHMIVGDIKTWPKGLKLSSATQKRSMELPDGSSSMMHFLAVEVLGPKGANDRILVLARSEHTAHELRYIAKRAALISVIPIVVFALLAGMFLSHRALSRIKDMHEAIDLIMEGDLHERLPAGHERDDLERLASSVNRMLDRLEQLMGEMRDVGNDIAHDLRTPLARVHTRLERAVSASHGAAYLEHVISQASRDLEQCFSIITALLRIGEIETRQRKAGFAWVTVEPLMTGIADLYEPIAETQGLSLRVLHTQEPIMLYGDVDLLNEVLANFVDNAIKFTPAGGEIALRAGAEDDGRVWLEVSDTGIGIPQEERQAVLGRFYRSDKSRHVPGSGLGLSLVSAILRLHGASLSIQENDQARTRTGTVFRVVFPLPSERGEIRAAS